MLDSYAQIQVLRFAVDDRLFYSKSTHKLNRWSLSIQRHMEDTKTSLNKLIIDSRLHPQSHILNQTLQLIYW